MVWSQCTKKKQSILKCIYLRIYRKCRKVVRIYFLYLLTYICLKYHISGLYPAPSMRRSKIKEHLFQNGQEFADTMWLK